ncbi:MAG: hypothetical protein ACREJ3_00200, partial [Polyangiaceae bacterium]
MPDDEQKPDDNRPDETASATDAERRDQFRPEAIAARVDRLGGETDSDRVAREEEAKLLALKAQSTEHKTSGLESAASKRLSRIGEAKVKRPSALTGPLSPGADPLLARAARLGKWIQDHQQLFAGLVAIGLVGAIGFGSFVYWQNQREG